VLNLKNLEFNLEKEDIVDTWKYVTVFDIKIGFHNKQCVQTLDRIDSDKGYIKGNIQVICSKANRLKNNGTIEDFEKIISYMKNGLKDGK
jgi:hypothetical protein